MDAAAAKTRSIERKRRADARRRRRTERREARLRYKRRTDPYETAARALARAGLLRQGDTIAGDPTAPRDAAVAAAAMSVAMHLSLSSRSAPSRYRRLSLHTWSRTVLASNLRAFWRCA